MIELRVITPGKYWTVYRGKKYLGAIALLTDGTYNAVGEGLHMGEHATLDAAKASFEAIQ